MESHSHSSATTSSQTNTVTEEAITHFFQLIADRNYSAQCNVVRFCKNIYC